MLKHAHITLAHSPSLQGPIMKLLTSLSKGQPFAVVIQPGAGAPVSTYLDEWKMAKLAGCTGELCKLSELKGTVKVNIFVINTMTEKEQADILLGTNEQLISAVTDPDIIIINDPYKSFMGVLGLKTQKVSDRVAYLPEAIVCDADGEVVNTIKYNDLTPGKVREPEIYVRSIVNALMESIDLMESITATKKCRTSSGTMFASRLSPRGGSAGTVPTNDVLSSM